MPDPTSRPRANSDAAFERAKRIIPGGVNSPGRAFGAVGGNPVFIKEAEGCIITDLDGNKYIDYIGGSGPLIAGHADERVITAMSKAIGRGTQFGAAVESETLLAGVILSAFPAMEMLRFVNTGTEAVMAAIRLARSATGRELLVRCGGGYHGWSDVVQPHAPMTAEVPYNDLDRAKKVFDERSGEIACFIVEPVAGSMGVIPPAPGYLQGLRELCDRHNALLIFDEIMTGFRVGWGGAQERFHVRPDITCLGKVIGGGLPIGAFGGSRQLMEMLQPLGKVEQGGTFSGNPLSMAGGLATLEILKEPGTYETLEERGEMLARGIRASAEDNKVPITINRVGSMLTVFFTDQFDWPIINHADANACDTKRFATFYRALLDAGILPTPDPLAPWFISLAHGEDAITKTIEAMDAAFKQVAQSQPTP